MNRSVATRQNSEPLLDSKFEKLIQGKLQKLGYQTEIHVGHSNYKIDLAVVDPDDPSKYILAIETDDQAFSSANSIRERDVMRQKFLESRGWKVERIWSRNWWRDSDREIDRVHRTIEQLRI